VTLLLLGGCASTSPRPAFRDVAATVEARSGHRVAWDQGTEEDREVAEAIGRLLARDLTVDGAVQVALLGSPALRAKLEELSLGQADLVQAGLLKNPVLGVGITTWEQEHIDPNLFFSVEQDFLDLVTMPLRKRVAATEMEAIKLEVGDHVLEVAAEVRTAFYAAQAAEQVLATRRLIGEAAQASADLARRQNEAGNMNDLALNAELGLASTTRVERLRAEADAAVARERLTKLMGVWGTRTAWRVAPRLPELPREEVTPDKLESRAVAERLDLGAARRQLQALDYALSLAKTTRWFGTVNVAVQAGRLRHDGRVAFGPSTAIEVPLFDQRQAALARLEAMRRVLKSNLEALAIDVRSDVRAARARVAAARAVVEEYGTVLVPIRENIVQLSQQYYDAMLLGVYQLLLAKQTEFATYREYIEALRDYWIARSDLERAVGGRVGAARPSTASPPTSASPPRSASPAPPPTPHDPRHTGRSTP